MAGKTNFTRYLIYGVIGLVAFGILFGLVKSFFSKEEAVIAADDSTIVLSVTTQPHDAKIFVDGVLQSNPKIRLPESASQTYRIEVRASGYAPQAFEVTPTNNQTLNVELERKRRSQFDE